VRGDGRFHALFPRCATARLFAVAQDQSSSPQNSPLGKGMFYVEGIVYQYVAGTDYTVVAAAHSVLNRKFLAVKVRVYNAGQRSVTVKPEDVVLEDANGGHALAALSGAALAKKMRHPYNWARLAVTPVAGGEAQAPDDTATITPQLVEMMKAMAAQAQGRELRPCREARIFFTPIPRRSASGRGYAGRECLRPGMPAAQC